MAEADFWKQKDDGGRGLRDQIHGVRLEVEKVRSETAKMDTGLTDRIGGVRLEIGDVRLEVEKFRTELTDQVGGVGLEVEKVRTEVARSETRLVEKIGEAESRLSDRMEGLERSLRGWLVIGVSVIGAMIALLGLFG